MLNLWTIKIRKRSQNSEEIRFELEMETDKMKQERSGGSKDQVPIDLLPTQVDHGSYIFSLKKKNLIFLSLFIALKPNPTSPTLSINAPHHLQFKTLRNCLKSHQKRKPTN